MRRIDRRTIVHGDRSVLVPGRFEQDIGNAMIRCALCPRRCGAPRDELRGEGVCGMGLLPRIARAALHFGEEPCISGSKGSGTLFFSGCALNCIYCQNATISHGGVGWPVSIDDLGRIFKRLEDQGAHNLNLVSAAHFWPSVVQALRAYPPGIPVVYNSSGFESLESLDALRGLVDVYLPDLKYLDQEGAETLSGAPDYPRVACAAVARMCEQTGPAQYDAQGLMIRGTLVRHLVLPGRTVESMQVLNWISEHLPKGTPVSLMGQYTPYGEALRRPGLDHPLPSKAYRRVQDHMHALGLEGYVQGRAHGTDLIPQWDGTGVR